MIQSATERRARYRAKAQSAQGCGSKTDDRDVKEAYADLAKSWANLAESIPSTDESRAQ